MATRYADPPLAFIPPPTQKVRIAYVAGPALAATNDAVATLPEAGETLDQVAQSPVDQAPLKHAVANIVTTASELLSRDFAMRFFEWLEVAAYFSMRCGDDDESSVRCTAHSVTKEALEREPSINIHDRAIKAYLELIEVADAPPCGPLERDEAYSPPAYGLLAECASVSPLPEMIDSMARLAFSASPPDQYSMSHDVATLIMNAANRARTDMRLRKPASAKAIWDVLLGSHDFLYARFQATDIDDPQSGPMLERWCDTQDRLLEQTPAPDMAALAKKLELAFARYCETAMPAETQQAILADVQRLAADLELAR